MNLTVGELKRILNSDKFPDDTPIVVSYSHDNVDEILGFRYIRTVGTLVCEREEKNTVLCFASSMKNSTIDEIVRKHDKTIDCTGVYY